MILYLDTSALVKLYAVEEGREVVEQAVEEAELMAASVVAYAEARAALAHKAREGVFSPEQHREAIEVLDEDWETFEKLEVTGGIARAAGDLAEKHALRGFDTVHPASALLVRAASLEQDDEEAEEDAIRFLSFDSNLTGVARKVMRVYEPGDRDHS